MCIIEADFYTAVLNTTLTQGTLVVFVTVGQAKVTHTFLPQRTGLNNIIENFVRLKLVHATLKKKKTESRSLIKVSLLLFRAPTIYSNALIHTLCGVRTHPCDGSGNPFLGIPLNPLGHEQTGSVPSAVQMALGPQALISLQGS